MAYQNVKQLMSNCENSAAYDFTLECDHEDYKALQPLERFLIYKAAAVGKCILSDIEKRKADERTAKGRYHEAAEFCVNNYHKYPDLTDWDGWDGKCKLAVDLYEQLWGWRDGERRRYGSLSRTVESLGALGGDTLNSVQTTLNCYLEVLKDQEDSYRKQLLPSPSDPGKPGKASIRFCIQLYQLFGKDFIKQLAGQEELSGFVGLTHTMGNLVLIPAGYNGQRGKAEQMRDYADLSLYNLFHNCDGKSGRFFGKDEKTRKKNGSRYINFFFLWDYVKKTEDGTYEVMPLCASHDLKMHVWELMDIWDNRNVLPKNEELEELCKNINSRIIRRGRFMQAMLEISMKYPDIYTRLMQEVFLTERVYEGYGEVIKTIREKLHDCEVDVYNAVNALLKDLED